jgi:hypothetical protein
LSPWMLYSQILFYLSRMCYGSCLGWYRYSVCPCEI